MPASSYRLLVTFTQHPVALLCVWCVAVVMIVGLLPRAWTRALVGARARTAMAVAAVACFVTIVCAYVAYPAYFDRVEPAVTSVSWLFVARGYPLYPDPQDPQRYAHVYGPVLFLVQGWTLRALGPSIVLSKVPGALAALGSLVLLLVAVGRAGAARHAWPVVGVAAVLLLVFQNMAFWNRPDPFILLLVTAAVLLEPSRRPAALYAVAVAAGLAVNLKITAVLYFVPFVPVLLAQHAPSRIVIAALVSLAVVAAPFLLPHVDAGHYWYWLRYCTGGTLVRRTFIANAEWAALLIVPIVLARVWRARPLSTQERLRIGCLAAAIAAVVTLAAIPGAGPYHLLPFVPLVLLTAIRVAGPGASFPTSAPMFGTAMISAGVVLSWLTVASLQQYRFISALDWRAAGALRRDLAALQPELGTGRTALGYSTDQPLAAMFRPMFVFERDPYLVDGPALMDHQMNAIEIPPGTVRLLRNCLVETFVLRADGPPFSTRNIYPSTGHRSVFAGDFAQAFHASFRLEASRGLFDVWRCQPQAPQIAATPAVAPR